MDVSNGVHVASLLSNSHKFSTDALCYLAYNPSFSSYFLVNIK